MAIISFDYNFIFIKTAKTAGTSIEADLSQRIGLRDIVTPIRPKVDGHVCRNYQDASGKQLFYNHMPAIEIRQLIGEEKFNSMYKFCVEREPVRKCISYYHMQQNSSLHNKTGRIISWEEYCSSGSFPIDHLKYLQFNSGKTHILVDEVLQYEKLDVELPNLLEKVGIRNFVLKTRAKSEYSKRTLIREEDVTITQREKIYRAFSGGLKVVNLYRNE